MHHIYHRVLLSAFVMGAWLLVGCSDNGSGPGNGTTAMTGDHLWSAHFGDAVGDRSVTGVAVDASGNVIVVGYFTDTIDFGGSVLTSAGGSDIFVAKFGANGQHLWSKRFGDADEQYALAVTVDNQRNIIMTGGFFGTVDFGGATLTSVGADDAFVAKFNSGGVHVWSASYGGPSGQRPNTITTDSSGNVLVAGYFSGTVDFGGGVLTSAGGADLFMAKLGSAGGHVWSKRFGDASDQYTSGIALDVSGNVVLAGCFDGMVDFGGGSLTSAGNFDAFLAKFSPSGSHMWSERFGGASSETTFRLAVDGSGNSIITGYFNGTVNFGGGALTSAGGNDIFLAKFGPSGSHMWSQRFGDAVDQAAHGLAVDGSGHVVISGPFNGTVDFGGGALTSVGAADIFVARFDPSGTALWSERFGDTNSDAAELAATDPPGNMIVTGFFSGTVDFGGGALMSTGANDIFVAKFSR